MNRTRWIPRATLGLAAALTLTPAVARAVGLCLKPGGRWIVVDRVAHDRDE